MKYCSQCGNEVKDGQSFCNRCGHKLSSIKEREKEFNLNEITNENPSENSKVGLNENTKGDFSNDADMNTTENLSEDIDNMKCIVVDAPREGNFVLSKKAKIGIIGTSIIVILAIMFLKAGNLFTQPSKTVASFEKAISSGDKKELINILYCSDKRLGINKENIDPLLAYFKENPSYLNQMSKDLNKEAFKVASIKNSYNLKKDDSQNMLSIVCVGKKLIFFPNYKISIKPSFIQINASIKDTSFFLNNINLGNSDIDNFSKEFGPFIPGKYNLIAKYNGKYISLNESYSVDFFNQENAVQGKQIVDVLTNTNYVKIESEYSDAKIFVNDKDSGAKVADAENFGPLSSGTKVYAVATENGNQLKSQEYIIEPENNSIYLSFEEAINVIKYLENDLTNLIDNYTYYLGAAVNNNNSSMLNPYLYPEGKLYMEQQSYVPATYKNGIREYRDSFNIVSYNLNADNKSGTIKTQEVYSIDNKGVTSVKTFKYTYKFKYNEEMGTYQLESILS